MIQSPKLDSVYHPVKGFFTQSSKKVFSFQELKEIFKTKRALWKLRDNLTPENFIAELLEKEILSKTTLDLGDPVSLILDRYLVGHPSPHEVAVSIKPKAYLSHYSAVLYNNLTTQFPKAIYVTSELSKKNKPPRLPLTQEAIDNAFTRPQRMSGLKGKLGDYNLILLNGMNTRRAGVWTALENESPISVTNLERTLIDITVRPNYAGGVFAVLEAYRGSLESISVNKLVILLKRINFIYPYHQVIGFYLERAGFTGKPMDLLRKIERTHNFYLTYQMEEKEYSKDWKLYYPRGM